MLQPRCLSPSARRAISGSRFQRCSEDKAAYDQPRGDRRIVRGPGARRAGPGAARGHRLGQDRGVTIAHVIQRLQRPAIVLAPNKNYLAAQLYGEDGELLPRERGRVFRLVAYDYYLSRKPTSRAPTLMLRRNPQLNEQIDRMRHSATRAILERRDVVVVASVSCIYGIGSVETYSQMTRIGAGQRADQPQPAAVAFRRDDGIIAATTLISCAARSGCAATRSRSFPAHYRGSRLARLRCSATRSKASTGKSTR